MKGPTACATLFALLAAAALGGCIVQSEPAAQVRVIIRDARTGRLLDDCVVLQAFCKTGLGMVSFMGDLGNWRAGRRTVWASAVRLDSGGPMSHPPSMVPVVPLYPGYVTQEAGHDFLICRRGYEPKHTGPAPPPEGMWLPDIHARPGDRSAGGQGKTDRRQPVLLVVDLEPHAPGRRDSDRNVVWRVRDAFSGFLPWLSPKDPPCREALMIFAEQLRAVEGHQRGKDFESTDLRNQARKLLTGIEYLLAEDAVPAGVPR